MVAGAKVWDGAAWVDAVGGGGDTLAVPNVIESSGYVSAAAAGTANTKGAWVELIASTDAAATLLHIDASLGTGNGVDTGALFDIGIGAAAAESVIIANVGAGFHGPQSPGMLFPVAIPSGSRVAMRWQSNVGTLPVGAVVRVQVLDGNDTSPASLDTIGAVTASSRGTNLPSNDTYVQLTASTSREYQAIVAVPTGSVAAFATEVSTYTVATGAGGSEVALFSFEVGTVTTEQIYHDGYYPVHRATIPAGTRLAVKQSIGRTYRDVILYGVPA